jgi:hypothetical protein
MPSRYRKDSRSDPYDASMANLRKARASCRYHPPRPWRSPQEMLMVRRLALWWWTCRDSSRPSARTWAKQLGVTHVWLLKLVRKFETDPAEVRRLQAYGDPTLAQGWSKSRLACELFLDRRTVKRILQKVTQNVGKNLSPTAVETAEKRQRRPTV